MRSVMIMAACLLATSAGGCALDDFEKCAPLSCADQGVECLTWPDQCGGVVSCGSCTANERCVGVFNEVPYTCEGTSEVSHIDEPIPQSAARATEAVGHADATGASLWSCR